MPSLSDYGNLVIVIELLLLYQMLKLEVFSKKSRLKPKTQKT